MSRRALAVLIACFGTVFTVYSIRYGYGVFLPQMLPDLAISKTEAGVISASYFVAYTVLSPVFGLLGDRYNSRALIASFTAVLGVGTFLMAFSSSVIQASLFFTLAGIGAAAGWAPVMALARRWVSPKIKGRALALVDVGSSLGIVWVGTGVPLVVTTMGWRVGWMTLGALGLLMAVLDFILMRNNPPVQPDISLPQPKRPAAVPLRVIYGGLMRDKRFWLLGLAYLFNGFSILIPFTFLSTYAVQELAFPYEVAARLFIYIGIGAMVGKIMLGSLSDKVGRIGIMMLCMTLIALGTLGMMYFRELLPLTLSTIVFSLGYGAIWALYAAAASDYFSKELAGSIIGLWTMYLGIGSIMSPIIAGWLADTTGTLAWSFVLAMGGAVISLGLLLPVWRGVSGSYR